MLDHGLWLHWNLDHGLLLHRRLNHWLLWHRRLNHRLLWHRRLNHWLLLGRLLRNYGIPRNRNLWYRGRTDLFSGRPPVFGGRGGDVEMTGHREGSSPATLSRCHAPAICPIVQWQRETGS